MSTKAYRQKIAQSVAKAAATRSRSTGSPVDAERLRSMVANKKAAAKPRAGFAQTRCGGRSNSAGHGAPTPCRSKGHRSCVSQLQAVTQTDPARSPPGTRLSRRVRTALDEPQLRRSPECCLHQRPKDSRVALEVSVNQTGARAVDQALAVEFDIHADVLEVARSLASISKVKNKPVFLRALRLR